MTTPHAHGRSLAGLGFLVIPVAMTLAGLAIATPTPQQAQAPRPAPPLPAQIQDPGVADAEAPEPDFVDPDQLPRVREGMTDQEEAAVILVEQILAEQQLLLAGRNFVYQSDDRRDPFRSLVRTRQRELAAPEQRPPGLGGFLINEIAVAAVAQYQGRWHAMLVGLDGRTYFAEVGTALFDGRVSEISENEVVFEQEVEDLLGARSTRRVVKRLTGS